MPDLPLARVLKDYGITSPSAQDAARNALVKAGTISGRPNRVNISDEKVGPARSALEAAFLWHCGNGDCRREASSSSVPTLLVGQQSCAICGGSGDRKALKRLAKAANRAGVTRILVVGGTENKWREIRAGSPDGLEWRFVDGVKARDDRYFRNHRRWADLRVVWGSTPLDHRVSNQFGPAMGGRVVTLSRRGIAALVDAVVRHIEGQGRRA